ncbi:hypothetical protein FRX31_025009 [Thalictrum thalictroides]|uniref:Uncharacterized protein n=1 Tax=Thalictrum thalictroides TaxID=46969 RepID=A0A7J6VMM4_THATH|nr:hypothetical protein FRX31_025009 [Thalictrum thalictroides]
MTTTVRHASLKFNNFFSLCKIGELGVGITAKEGACRTVQPGEAESAHRCAADQGSHGLNMRQFASIIAAGSLPGCQDNFSSIAAGIASRHGHNTKTVATGYGNQGLTMGRLAKSPAAGQCEAHMDEGKTAIEADAGQGCMGHDLEHSSMEAAAGQKGKGVAASCRQYDVSKMDKETAAGEGISGSFGELGVGVGKAAKEAAAGGTSPP